MIDDIKAWLIGAFKSVTVWFNTVVGTFVLVLPDIQASMPDLAQHLPNSVYRWLAIGLVVSNIALRAKTRLPLTAK